MYNKAEVKIKHRFTSTPPLRLDGVVLRHRDNVLLLSLLLLLSADIPQF
jgi:hypothetical protein